MAKTKTITTRTRTAPKVPKPGNEPFLFVRILDKADDIGRGIKSLENAAEGAFIDSNATTAINWMLEHLERDHDELRAMLQEAHVANGGPNV